MEQESGYLTVAEIAVALKLSKMTVYRMIRSGELPAAQFGKSLRIAERAFSEYLKRSRFEPVRRAFAADMAYANWSGEMQ